MLAKFQAEGASLKAPCSLKARRSRLYSLPALERKDPNEQAALDLRSALPPFNRASQHDPIQIGSAIFSNCLPRF